MVADIMSRAVAARTAFFEAIEELEAALGREVNVRELEARIDCQCDGRSDVTEQEALLILSTASPLRAVVLR